MRRIMEQAIGLITGGAEPPTASPHECAANSHAYVVEHITATTSHLYRSDPAAPAESLARIQQMAAAVLTAIGAHDIDAGRDELHSAA